MTRLFVASALALACAFASPIASAEESAAADRVIISPAVERVADISVASVKPEGASSWSSATFATLGGAVHNPLAMPRVGLDVYLPSGLGLGGAVGFSNITTNNDGTSSDTTFRAFLVSPRVSWRACITSMFDVVPRLGVTFVSASVEGNQGLRAVALSPEVLGVVRLTSSFNLIAAVAHDHLMAASRIGNQDMRGLSLQFWLGLGGYL